MSERREISALLEQIPIRNRIRYIIAYRRLKSKILSQKPRGYKELESRVLEYLKQYPKTMMILTSNGITVEHIKNKLQHYVS